MVFYGDWIQGADFQRAGTFGQGAAIRADDYVAGSVANPDYQPIEVSGLANSATVGAQAAAAFSGQGNLFSSTAMQLGVGGGVATARGDYFSAQYLFYCSLNLPGEPLPPGAIDVEWEASGCEPVSTIWAFGGGSGQTWAMDSGISAGPVVAHLTASVDQAAIDGASSQYAAPYPISVADFTVGPSGVTIPGPVDMTPHLRPDGKFLAALRIDPLVFSSVTGERSKQALAQTDASVAATYTLHPPRHRFVYSEAPQPLPARPAYSRIVQRGSDGLGMTGGRRIVQARTMQATNRRGAAIR